MDERNERLKKLNNITEEYQPDMALPNEALYRINQKEATVTYKKPFAKRLFPIVSVLFCAIALCIFLPIYFSLQNSNSPDIPDIPKITIYTSDNIKLEIVEDLDSFVSENDYGFKFFKDEFVKTQCAFIIDDSSTAYIVQDMFCFTESGLDNVNLKIVLLENSEFDFYSSFEMLPLNSTIDNLSVSYSSTVSGDEICYKAKFTYENFSYFMEIVTYDTQSDKITEYISKLLNI